MTYFSNHYHSYSYIKKIVNTTPLCQQTKMKHERKTKLVTFFFMLFNLVSNQVDNCPNKSWNIALIFFPIIIFFYGSKVCLIILNFTSSTCIVRWNFLRLFYNIHTLFKCKYHGNHMSLLASFRSVGVSWTGKCYVDILVVG